LAKHRDTPGERVPTVQDFWKKLPDRPKRWLKRQWFEHLSGYDTGRDLLFLNHGYAPDDERDALPLDDVDEPNRYPIQLYHHIAAPGAWAGAEAIEVGCGRGGGADYIARALAPRSLVAIDLTTSAIRFASDAYEVPGLSFRQGDAHALPFADASLDIVLNVESSLLYEHPNRFFAEVKRVLRPGGTFLFADYRKAKKAARLYDQLKSSGLELLEEEDITHNVLVSMERESDRKRDLIARHAPRFLQSSFQRFAAVRGEGDEEFDAFASRARVYLRFVLRKPDASDT
jgi:ubiquinone/menaquinone biosynthesis C-methylase UbiE